MNDELIQKLLDEGHDLEATSSPNDELTIYQKLYDMLNHHQSYTLSPGFAHRVTARLQPQKKEKSYKLIFPIVGGILAFVPVMIFVIGSFGESLSVTTHNVQIALYFVLTLVITGLYRVIERKYLSSPGLSSKKQ
jgi:hypothetical protein